MWINNRQRGDSRNFATAADPFPTTFLGWPYLGTTDAVQINPVDDSDSRNRSRDMCDTRRLVPRARRPKASLCGHVVGQSRMSSQLGKPKLDTRAISLRWRNFVLRWQPQFVIQGMRGVRLMG
jgi:hypothetical protein